MIPTLLGNLVGGGLFVAAPYWYNYLTGEGNVQVDLILARSRQPWRPVVQCAERNLTRIASRANIHSLAKNLTIYLTQAASS